MTYLSFLVAHMRIRELWKWFLQEQEELQHRNGKYANYNKLSLHF